MGHVRERSVALAVAAVLMLAGCGGDDDGGSSGQEAISQDAEAKSAALTAQTAMEVYATDQGGFYEGATTEKLSKIDPTLSVDDLAVTAEPAGYELTVESESGNAFTITRNEAGTVTRNCETEGDGGCPDGGEW